MPRNSRCQQVVAQRRLTWNPAFGRLRLGWPPLALQLLGPDDIRVAGVQREQRVHLGAAACAGRTLLSADL
jgi:hypothetical protein